MMNLEIPDDELWLLAGDFNSYRSEENRNREGEPTRYVHFQQFY
jgi:hypothetical protein